jgi:hypothetical protein
MFSFFRKPQGISDYAALAEDVRGRAVSELGRQFLEHRGRLIHKWIDYLDIYHRYFASFRGSDVVFLEIGVSEGGSLDMWREYFGARATICGIDIDPLCATRVDEPNIVRIGSQDDPVFLDTVIAEMGRPHIILDDGSHVARHQAASFRHLWPSLRTGGIYVIEDLHTAYWPKWGGGYRRRGSAIEMVKDLIDAQHGWWHDRPPIVPASEVHAIHQHESIVFIEKGDKARPAHVKVGGRDTPASSGSSPLTPPGT